jgi:hypothetical protein
MPDQLLIGRICEGEPMFGTLKQRRETRRLGEHLPQAAKLFTAVSIASGMIAWMVHLPTMRA